MRIATPVLFVAAAIAGISTAAIGSRPLKAARPRPASPSQAFLSPPEVVSVEDVKYPPGTNVGGIVVLDVAITDKGEAVEIGAVRDIPPLTTAAATAVQSWKFKRAAQENDMPLPSAITVAFVFRAPVANWQPPSFASAMPNPGSSTNAVIPAGILSVAYPDYAAAGNAEGAVILQLALDATGKISDTRILHGVDNLNSLAQAAAKDWKFQPSIFQGDAVRSNVAIAFVFTPVAANP